MKRMVTSKIYVISLSFVAVLFFLSACLGFAYDVSCILQEEAFGPGFFWCGIFGGLTWLFGIALNRLACVVEFDVTGIRRRGLLFGFKRECKKEDILRAEIRYVWREGDFIFLIDRQLEEKDRAFNRWRKDSYICFKKAKRTWILYKHIWRGDGMEHIWEAVVELLFGRLKDTPDTMPDMDYCPAFTVKTPGKKHILPIVGMIVIFAVLFITVEEETRYLHLAFTVLGLILLALTLRICSLRVSVTEETLTQTGFTRRKKVLRWEEVRCLRQITATDKKEVLLALYNREGRCVLDVDSEMENAWYVVKMAEHKGVPIFEEKDLTLKQMLHL